MSPPSGGARTDETFIQRQRETGAVSRPPTPINGGFGPLLRWTVTSPIIRITRARYISKMLLFRLVGLSINRTRCSPTKTKRGLHPPLRNVRRHVRPPAAWSSSCVVGGGPGQAAEDRGNRLQGAEFETTTWISRYVVHFTPAHRQYSHHVSHNLSRRRRLPSAARTWMTKQMRRS